MDVRTPDTREQKLGILLITPTKLSYTSCTVTVRHSDDDITYNNHTAFTTVTAVGAQSLALASTIQQYVSVAWAWVGAGADQSITFAVGLAVD